MYEYEKDTINRFGYHCRYIHHSSEPVLYKAQTYLLRACQRELYLKPPLVQ